MAREELYQEVDLDHLKMFDYEKHWNLFPTSVNKLSQTSLLQLPLPTNVVTWIFLSHAIMDLLSAVNLFAKFQKSP